MPSSRSSLQSLQSLQSFAVVARAPFCPQGARRSRGTLPRQNGFPPLLWIPGFGRSTRRSPAGPLALPVRSPLPKQERASAMAGCGPTRRPWLPAWPAWASAAATASPCSSRPGWSSSAPSSPLQRLAAVPCAFDPAVAPATSARPRRAGAPGLVLAAGPAADGLCKPVTQPVCAERTSRRCRISLPRCRSRAVAAAARTSRASCSPPRAPPASRGPPSSPTATRSPSLRAARDLLEPRTPATSSSAGYRPGTTSACSASFSVPSTSERLPPGRPGDPDAAAVAADGVGGPRHRHRRAGLRLPPGRAPGGPRAARSLVAPRRDQRRRAGAPEHHPRLRAALRRAGVVRPGYGLAEATLGVTCLLAGEPLRVDAGATSRCGRPLPGVEVRIDGDCRRRDPRPLPRGLRRLLRRRRKRPARRCATDGSTPATSAGSTPTGTSTCSAASGRCSRGEALPWRPAELEEPAESVPGVRTAAAVGLPPAADAATEEIVLAVEPDPAAAHEPPDLASAAAAAVEAALGFAPDAVLVLAPRTIPRTANGKTRHSLLRAGIASGELERRGAVLFSLRTQQGAQEAQAELGGRLQEIALEPARRGRGQGALRGRSRSESLAGRDLHLASTPAGGERHDPRACEPRQGKGPRASSKSRPRQEAPRPGPAARRAPTPRSRPIRGG